MKNTITSEKTSQYIEACVSARQNSKGETGAMPRKQRKTRAPNGDGSFREKTRTYNGKTTKYIEYRITIHDPVTGASKSMSFTGKTKKAVMDKAKKAEASLNIGAYQDAKKMAASEWFAFWLENYCKGRVKPSTYSSYEGIIRIHILPEIGGLKLQAVKGTHIQRLYNTMINKELSAKTVKNVSTVLHKAFQNAIKLGYLTANPCDGAELPKVIKPDIKPLEDEEIPKFLDAIRNSPMENAYALCLFTGLREGECLGLSWRQVCFEKRKLVIDQQLQKGKGKNSEYTIISTKNSKSRTIVLPPIALDYLRAEKAKQAENQLRMGSSWSNPNDLVFTDAKGTHYKISTFYKTFKRLAASIGRPDLRPHDLRHTAATIAIACGTDTKTVQDMLGHATASFTLSTYAHTSKKMQEDAASRIQAYYDNLPAAK